ncbi:YmiA family putative membrane protein [Serratia plymuthica]
MRDVKRKAWLCVFAISGLFWLLVGLLLWWWLG